MGQGMCHGAPWRDHKESPPEAGLSEGGSEGPDHREEGHNREEAIVEVCAKMHSVRAESTDLGAAGHCGARRAP